MENGNMEKVAMETSDFATEDNKANLMESRPQEIQQEQDNVQAILKGIEYQKSVRSGFIIFMKIVF